MRQQRQRSAFATPLRSNSPFPDPDPLHYRSPKVVRDRGRRITRELLILLMSAKHEVQIRPGPPTVPATIDDALLSGTQG
jgi:hypothetical protein